METTVKINGALLQQDVQNSDINYSNISDIIEAILEFIRHGHYIAVIMLVNP
jgi:hypothetical protein